MNQKEQEIYLKNLGARIRELRKAKFGFGGKRALAKAAGITDATIYRVEEGSVATNILVLIKISIALDVPFSELVDQKTLEEFRAKRVEVSTTPEVDRRGRPKKEKVEG